MSFSAISDYWQSHGYSKAEADAIECEQIAAAIKEQENLDRDEQGWFNME